MSRQASLAFGVGTDPWHGRMNKRVRFVLRANGREDVYVGVVKHVSPTASLIKLRTEEENVRGKTISKVVHIPTELVVDGTIRELKPSESA